MCNSKNCYNRLDTRTFYCEPCLLKQAEREEKRKELLNKLPETALGVVATAGTVIGAVVGIKKDVKKLKR